MHFVSAFFKLLTVTTVVSINHQLTKLSVGVYIAQKCSSITGKHESPICRKNNVGELESFLFHNFKCNTNLQNKELFAYDIIVV